MSYYKETGIFASKVIFTDEAVVQAAGNLLQYARNCINKEESCIFDVLMTSLWMTFHHLQSSKFKEKESEESFKEPSKVVNLESESLEPENSKEGTVTENERPVENEDENVQKPDQNCKSNKRKPAVESFSNKILGLKQSSEGISAYRVEGKDKNEPKIAVSEVSEDRASKKDLLAKGHSCEDDVKKTDTVRKEEIGKEQNDEEMNDKQHVSSNSDDDDVMIIEKEIITIEIDDDDYTDENLNLKVNQQSEEKTFHTCSDQNKLASLKTDNSEGLLYDMTCENVEDTNSDLTDCGVNRGLNSCKIDETSELRLTNVTGNVHGEKDSTDIKYPTSLPDGLIIEINVDDNDEENGNESTEMKKSDISISKATTPGSREKRHCARKEKERRRSFLKRSADSKDSIEISSTEQSDLIQAQPIMMMSNFYNSPVTSVGKVSETQTRLGPLVSVNTHVQQLQQHHQQPHLLLPMNLQQQQPLPQQTHSTAFEEQNDQFHKAILQLPPNFLKKLVTDARSRFMTDSKVDFAAFDNVVQQIVQFYPFFQGRVEELCQQLLQHSYRLYSGYRTWKEQNKSTHETNQWLDGSAENIVPKVEICMENAYGDFCSDPNIPVVQTNNFGTLSGSDQICRMLAPEVAYPEHKLFDNLNVNVPQCNTISVADYQSQTGSYFSFVPDYTNDQGAGKQHVAAVWSVVGKSPYQSEIFPPRSAKGKKRVKGTTISTSDVSGKTSVLSKKKTKMSTAKKRKKKSAKVKQENAGGKLRKINENSLRNLKQYKNSPTSVVQKVKAACTSTLKPKGTKKGVKISAKSLKNLKQYRSKNAPRNFVQEMETACNTVIKIEPKETTGKQIKSVQDEVIKHRKRGRPKGKKNVSNVLCLAGNTQLLDSSERGAKLKAQHKLNLYIEMMGEKSEMTGGKSEKRKKKDVIGLEKSS